MNAAYFKISGLAVAAMILTACSFAKGNTEAGGVDSGLTEDTVPATDSSSSLNKIVGDSVLIELQANPSTGYAWVCVSDSLQTLELADRKFQRSGGNGMMIGAGGTDVWTFKAVAEGEDTLRFRYRRSWENDSIPPKDSADFIVKVGPRQ